MMLVAILSFDRTAFGRSVTDAICAREAGSGVYRCVYWAEKGDYTNVTFFVTDVRAQEM
jgi:hypothetical protein